MNRAPAWVKPYCPQAERNPDDYEYPMHLWENIRRPAIRDECWLWQGPTHTRDKVPVINGQSARALLFQLLIRPLTPSERLRLTCHDKLCVFPGHMEVVSKRRNFKK